MTTSPEYRAFVEEQLAPLGPVTIRAMFGGAGVYSDGVMFALIADDELYFKADETTVPDFEAEGCGPFTYESKGKPIRMSYWKCPERLFEDPDEMADWARRAIAIAAKGKSRR